MTPAICQRRARLPLIFISGEVAMGKYRVKMWRRREKEHHCGQTLSPRLTTSPSLACTQHPSTRREHRLHRLKQKGSNHQSQPGLSQHWTGSEQPDHNSISLVNRQIRAEAPQVFRLYSDLMYCPETTKIQTPPATVDTTLLKWDVMQLH